MNFYSRLAPALIQVSVVLVQTQMAVALSAPEVSKIAQEITVQIESKTPRYGCGVIIKRSENTYTVLTAGHVVEAPDKYEIITPDQKHYPLNYSTVKLLPGVDLAILQFSSTENYSVAKIGNSDTSTEGTKAYVAGYPEPTFAINKSIYTFVPGIINANASKALREGYGLVYSNETKKGMSGAPVLNDSGEIIGIHGREDKDPKSENTGFYLGIPINTFLRMSQKVGIAMGVSPPAVVATEPKADDFLIQGRGKYDRGDFQGAIADYTSAIRLNPKYANAYNNRGLAHAQLGNKQEAINDYNQALQVDPNLALAYYNRGAARAQSGDKQGAIEDYNQALRIDPNYANAYNNRGLARAESGDKQKALLDYNQAIKLDPNLALAYNNRGGLRAESGDKQGAIEDYTQALRLDPSLAAAYNNRGYAYALSGDKQKAIDDYNQALRINPKLAVAYNNRGLAHAQLGDKQKAIDDYNQALLIDPNLAQAYSNRGSIYAESGDKQQAIADLQKASELFRQQGKTDDYQKTIALIKTLQPVPEESKVKN
jgi:tetratricopeptide (TPR) repeat protein